MKEIRRIAYAKINLALDVVGKREDGYHDLSMIMAQIGLHDKLRLKKIRENKILLKTNLPYLPTDERNLVYKIVAYMKELYHIDQGIFVDLYKVIPVGAGLAGGSSDGAQTILGMNELFELNLSMTTMLEIGKKFGADIPYCIRGGLMLAEGIGDVLTPIETGLAPDIVVVKPRVSVPTPYVYQNLRIETRQSHPDVGAVITAMGNNDLKSMSASMGNLLEEVTFEGYPDVLAVKEAMQRTKAIGVLMSGSGSAVFGIYENSREAKEASRYMTKHPLVKQAFATKMLKSEHHSNIS